MQQYHSYAVLALVFMLAFQYVQAEQLAPDHLVAVDRAFLPCKSVRLKLRIIGFRKGGIHQKEVRVASLEADVLRDDMRWSVRGNSSTVRFQQGTPTEYRGSFEYLVANDYLANVSWDGPKQGGPPSIFTATFAESARLDEPGVNTLLHGYLLFGFSPNHGKKLA